MCCGWDGECQVCRHEFPHRHMEIDREEPTDQEQRERKCRDCLDCNPPEDAPAREREHEHEDERELVDA